MKKTLLFLGFAAAVGFVSCNTDNNDTVPPIASFGIVQASPDAGNVDVYVGSAIAAQNFSYGSDTGYFTISPGTYTFQVAPAGTTSFVINSNINLAPGLGYSIFTIDSLSKIKTAVVEDNFTTPPADSVRVRFLHFSPDAPSVDLAVSGGSILFANRSFNDQATTPALASFTTLAAGTYNLEVRGANTTSVILPVPSVTLEGGKVYTLYAKGFAAGTGTQALGVGTLIHNDNQQ